MTNIVLTRGQEVISDSNYMVFTSGTYNIDDLVQVYHINNDAVPICSYTAHFIKYGYENGTETPTGIFKVHMSSNNPDYLDYDILGLHKKRTIINGELNRVQYYRDYDGISYSDLVVEENIVYNRNAVSGLVNTRNMTISWYLTDGTIGHEKSTIKYYSMIESIDEGIVRRNNMIAAAKLVVLGAVGLENGQNLLTELNLQINLFINGNTQPLRDAVAACTKSYLSAGLKTVIITELSF